MNIKFYYTLIIFSYSRDLLGDFFIFFSRLFNCNYCLSSFTDQNWFSKCYFKMCKLYYVYFGRIILPC